METGPLPLVGALSFPPLTHPRDLGTGIGHGTPPALGMERLLRPASEDGDVLTCEGADAFEGSAMGR